MTDNMYKHNRPAKLAAYQASVESAIAGNILPVLAYAKITRECDISCTYCVERNMLRHGDMGLAEWKRTADIAYMLGNRSISLVGGDPLLSPYVLDLVDYISDRDTLVSISTNGHCLTEKMLHNLDEAGLDSLGFSIDTLGGSDQPRFGKDLTPELEGILRYIAGSKCRFTTGIAAVVTRYNVALLPEMLRYFSGLGMPIRFTPMVRGVINHEYSRELALGEEDITEVTRIFDELSSMKSNGYLLANEGLGHLRPKMGTRTPAAVYQLHLGDDLPHSCQGGIYDLPIDNDGRLGTCCTGVTSSTHIFDLESTADYSASIDRNREFTDRCSGCPWPHKWILTHLPETGGFVKR